MILKEFYDELRKYKKDNKDIYVSLSEKWEQIGLIAIDNDKRLYILATFDIDEEYKIKRIKKINTLIKKINDDYVENNNIVEYNVIIYSVSNKYYDIKDIAEDIENCYTIGVVE